jgi:MFS family permease
MGFGIGSIVGPILGSSLYTLCGYESAYFYMGIIVWCFSFPQLVTQFIIPSPLYEKPDKKNKKKSFDQELATREPLLIESGRRSAGETLDLGDISSSSSSEARNVTFARPAPSTQNVSLN